MVVLSKLATGFYKNLGFKCDSFPIAKNIADTVLSLPFGPHITLNEIREVAKKIKMFFS